MRMPMPSVGSQTNNFLHGKKYKHPSQDQGADPETQAVVMLIAMRVLWEQENFENFSYEKNKKK